MRVAIAILLSTVLAVSAAAQDKKKSHSEAMMEMYAELAKPVASHDRLHTFAGKWNVVSKMWMSPGAPPLSAKGTAKGHMILGGRFLQLDTSLSGPFASDSLTILGFDRRTSDYTMVGYDTMGTYYITAAGKHDVAKNALVLDGSYAQPPHGGMQSYRFVLDQPRASEHRMRLYFTMPDGKDMLVNEVVMTRGE
jgi:hypothetical protein